jgi:hypothetical protein
MEYVFAGLLVAVAIAIVWCSGYVLYKLYGVHR